MCDVPAESWELHVVGWCCAVPQRRPAVGMGDGTLVKVQVDLGVLSGGDNAERRSMG